MSRPTLTPISSGNNGWDGNIDDDFDILADAPIPIKERTDIATLAALETAYPAAAHDRCFIWINLTTFGMTLCWSNGTAWITFGMEKRPVRTSSVTTSQVITDKFVRFTGAGTVDYDFLTANAWAGVTVEVRNDTAAIVSLDPNGSENINGSSTSLSLAAGSTARIYSDGTALYASIAT
jgi:hypothetical protein